MRVLVAAQEFKGSLTAADATAAIARGIRSARPDWEIATLPISDGGPGWLDTIESAVHGERVPAVVHDALGRPRHEYWLRLPGRGAVIEAARANGLSLIDPPLRDALRADSFGVGEFMADALRLGVRRMTVGAGGSATSDGGAGALRALGVRFIDASGRDLPPGGAPLAQLAAVHWPSYGWPPEIDLTVAADVTNPLCGPDGAARVYGPQKCASPAEVEVLEDALLNYARVLRNATGVDVAAMPGAGAAGGLAGGLAAALGARIISGFEAAAALLGLQRAVDRADFVVTGEGSFDLQSHRGKVTGGVIEMARRARKPVVVFAGRADIPGALTLTADTPDEKAAISRAAPLLEALAARWAATPTSHTP